MSLFQDVDRVIASAMTNLAGFFPPTEHQEWKHKIDWQPIPVHTISKADDYLLAPTARCDRFDYVMLNHLNANNYTGLFQQHRALIKHLEMNSGLKITKFQQIVTLYDTLKVELSKGKSYVQIISIVFTRIHHNCHLNL